jgi:endonuclease/exonuclease/phosphatase family metal-dependent hydrolase
MLSDIAVEPLPRRGEAEPRTAVLATAALAGGGRLSVAATHLSFDEDEAATQLIEVAKLLATRPEPRALLGDLNMGPDRCAELLEGTGLTLVDATVPTWPAVAPRSRIDHVALDGLAARAVEVLPRPPVSDHLPLLVEAD